VLVSLKHSNNNNYILRSKGQRSRSQQGHVWSKSAFLGIFKVSGSNVRDTDNLSFDGILVGVNGLLS